MIYSNLEYQLKLVLWICEGIYLIEMIYIYVCMYLSTLIFPKGLPEATTTAKRGASDPIDWLKRGEEPASPLLHCSPLYYSCRPLTRSRAQDRRRAGACIINSQNSSERIVMQRPRPGSDGSVCMHIHHLIRQSRIN